MFMLAGSQNPTEIGERLRNTYAVTAEFLSDIISQTCRRFSTTGHSARAARIERLIQSGAWTDAALALIELELPQWQLRRIAYDEGEWHCALSRQRELPDWLDQPVESRHADLALAILGAFVEARRIDVPLSQPSVPTVKPDTTSLYEPVMSDNFG